MTTGALMGPGENQMRDALVWSFAAVLGMAAILHAAEPANGWRGNGNGLWPESQAPIEWSRIPHSALEGMKAWVNGSGVYRNPQRAEAFLYCIGAPGSGALKPIAADEPPAAPAEPVDMQRLFNEKDLAGWDGDPRLWSVKNGVIRGETTAENPAKGNTFIIWKDGVTKDFDLRLSFRCNATNNSGIQYRSKHITGEKVPNQWVVRGYQHEIRNENTLPDVAGFIYDEGGKRGRICLVGEKAVWEQDGKKNVTGTLIDGPGFQKLFKLDDWNDVVIVARGNHIQHYLNNRLILDFADNDPALSLREGILALQLHAGKPMWVEFKNIRIKDLK